MAHGRRGSTAHRDVDRRELAAGLLDLRWRAVAFGAALLAGFGLIAACLAWWPSCSPAIPLVLWLVASGITAARLLAFECPRCHQKFFRTAYLFHATLQCVHCGQPCILQ